MYQQNFKKIAITENANEVLIKMLETLNKETLTKIKKQSLASWIILNYEKKHFSKPKEIKRVQKEIQNPIAYAKNLLRKLEETKQNPTQKEINSIFSRLR